MIFYNISLAVTLPYQSHDKHLGVASCASSLCHGSVTPNPNYIVRLDEFVTWSHKDSHTKAYSSLLSVQGKSIATKMGIGAAENAKVCLGCHSDNVAPLQRGPKFAISDGIGCEACHGGSERWIASHANTKATYKNDIVSGMYPTVNLVDRALLCESCHVGNSDKMATHEMMGAGHPRLSFEMDTYLALEPPHWNTKDTSYQHRKPTFTHSQTWAVGQLQGSILQLQLLQGVFVHKAGVFPELAMFNCTACHDSSIEHLQWTRRAMTQSTSPGMVPLNDSFWRMSWMIDRALNVKESTLLLEKGQALQKSVLVSREQVSAHAKELQLIMERLQQRIQGEPWTKAQTFNVLQSILEAGVDGEFRDYLGAEQMVMSAELLLIDMGQATHFKPQLDSLYSLTKDVDAFHSAEFINEVRALHDAM